MKLWFALATAGSFLIGSTAIAQSGSEGLFPAPTSYVEPADRVRLGYGDFLVNDFLGDGHDRWQTAAYVNSIITGQEWTGAAPEDIGSLIEYRFQAKIVAPGDLENPVPNDRLYSTSISLGAHTHFTLGAGEMSLGGDVVITGQMTGLARLQTHIHNALGRDVPSTETLNDMIPNGFHPGLVVEYGRPVSLNGSTTVRPFAELRTGDETLIRSGIDLYIGGLSNDDLLVRDQVTGQRYSTARGNNLGGYEFVLGGDITAMGSSIYLPSDRGPDMTDERARLRAGVVWQDNQNSVFYGVTWMSKEFDSQPESQVVGSIQVNLEF